MEKTRKASVFLSFIPFLVCLLRKFDALVTGKVVELVNWNAKITKGETTLSHTSLSKNRVSALTQSIKLDHGRDRFRNEPFNADTRPVPKPLFLHPSAKVRDEN